MFFGKTEKIFLIAISLIIIFNLNFSIDDFSEVKISETKFKFKIILVPLDSRPPCKDFVADLGRIANVNVVLPPSELLDYFTIPGETDKLKDWIFKNAAEADAIIISADQLLYGGLIAARENEIDDKSLETLKKFFIDLKNFVPHTPIYVFSILPRMQPQSSIDNFYQRRALTAYSRLIGQEHFGQSIDDEIFFELYSEIDSDNLKKYLSHFDISEKINRLLIDLTNDKIIDRFIIGSDDSEKFSIQNILIDKLNRYSYNSTDKINFTYGADEIALTLLAEFVEHNLNFKTKVYICYNDLNTPQMILPYMAVSIEEVVTKKLTQLNCEIVKTPIEADFILFVSVNAKNEDVKLIEDLINKGDKVALVDLSYNFDKNEILLPKLIEQDIAINSLIAYAGWNTASNSIGTAISQAVIFLNARSKSNDINYAVENVRFLNQRFIEDAFYLKDVIDTVNHALQKNGSYDNSYLDYGTEYEFASFIMKTAMAKRIADYKCSDAFKLPFAVETADGYKKYLQLKDFDTTLNYFWPRTFEIRFHIDNMTFKQVN